MNEKINAKMLSLNFVVSEIDAVYHTAAGLLGLSDSALGVLYGICCCGESCRLSDIYKLSGMPKQTVNSAIRKMEAKKLLYLENADGKSKKVILTKDGQELAKQTVMRLIAAENRIVASWAERDMEQFIELNRRYAEDLRKELSRL